MSRSPVILAASIAATVAVAAPSFAASPYDVIVGGDGSQRDVPFMGVARPADIGLHGASGDVLVHCDESKMTGVIHGGPDNVGHWGTIHDTQWSGCSGPLGLDMTIEHRGEWLLTTTDPNVTGLPLGDTSVDGSIDNVELHMYATNDPGGCAFTVTGAADDHFNEVDQILSVNEDGMNPNGRDMTISVGGGGSTCFGLISDGDPVSYFGDYTMTTDDGPIDLTPGS